jgi:MYXO-CTERM domain-containing protein
MKSRLGDLGRLGCVGVALMSIIVGRDARAANPERSWATYMGGSGGALVLAIAVDEEGNLYATGSTKALTGFASPGAHKDAATLLDQGEAFLAKFDPAGNRLWATYFGGTGDDAGRAVAVRGDVVVLGGDTRSKEGISLGATFQTSLSSDLDGFVAHFTADGVLTWGTYVGTYGYDSVEGVAIGDAGEVYATGYLTGSSELAVDSPHQAVLGGGSESDAFLLRLDAAGNKEWGTYYGGERADTGRSLALWAGGVVLGGETYSETNIASVGAYQTTQAASSDLFVAAFASDGVRQWGTYAGADFFEGWANVASHPDGGVVLVGQSDSPGLASDGTKVAGALDVVVFRFDSMGDRVWSTYFGGMADDSIEGVGVGPDGFVYIVGSTSSPDLASADAWQQTLSGESDAFAAALDDAGKRVWTTYYGGEAHEAASTGVFANGRINIGGRTASMLNISSPGAYQAYLNSGLDGFVAQLIPVRPLGAACGDAENCESGPCVDGVCCDAACGDSDVSDCQACSVAAGAAVDGTCGPRVGVCRPSIGECDSEEVCGGAGIECPADQIAADGSVCIDGTCAGGMCISDDATTGTTPTTGAADETTNTSTGALPMTGGASDGASGDPPASGDAGCGCTSSSTSPWSLGLFALLGLRGARRRRAGGRASGRGH